jgi:hypothetical protein
MATPAPRLDYRPTIRLFYHVDELPRLLGLARVAIARLIAGGELRTRLLGRDIVVLAEDLEAYLRTLPGGSLRERVGLPLRDGGRVKAKTGKAATEPAARPARSGT